MGFNDLVSRDFQDFVANSLQACDSALKLGADPEGPLEIKLCQAFDVFQSWIQLHRELCELERKQAQAGAQAAKEQAFFDHVIVEPGASFQVREGRPMLLTVRPRGGLLDQDDDAFATRSRLTVIR